MSWGILGDIEFEMASHPSAQSERSTADFAEHARIQGKPRLEWIGEGLDEVSLEISLHASVGDPESRVRQLRKAKSDHAPLPYVLGSGDFRGIYVITGLDVTTRKTDGFGRLVAATVGMTLREYTGKYTKPLPVPLGLRNSQQGAVGGLPLEKVSAGIKPLVTTAQQVLGYARTAGSLVRAGLDAYQFALDLKENPMTLLNRVPTLLGTAREVLAPLGGLGNAAGMLEDGGDLVRLGVDMASDINQAITALDGVDSGSVVSQVGYATMQMERAASRIEGASPRLAQIATDVITRRA